MEKMIEIFMKDLETTRVKFLMSINKRNMKILVWLLMGYYSWNYRMRKIEVMVSAMCSQCKEEDETHYALYKRPALSVFRRRYLGEIPFNKESKHFEPLEVVLRFECRRQEAFQPASLRNSTVGLISKPESSELRLSLISQPILPLWRLQTMKRTLF